MCHPDISFCLLLSLMLLLLKAVSKGASKCCCWCHCFCCRSPRTLLSLTMTPYTCLHFESVHRIESLISFAGFPFTHMGELSHLLSRASTICESPSWLALWLRRPYGGFCSSLVNRNWRFLKTLMSHVQLGGIATCVLYLICYVNYFLN